MASHKKSTLAKLIKNNAKLVANIASLTATRAALSVAYTILMAEGGEHPPSQPVLENLDKFAQADLIQMGTPGFMSTSSNLAMTAAHVRTKKMATMIWLPMQIP